MATTQVYGAKIDRHAEIVADANDLKAESGHSVSAVRRAERDALAELSETDESVDAVEDVALPSDRLGEPDAGQDGDDENGDGGEEDVGEEA